jgi:hypothetical protein
MIVIVNRFIVEALECREVGVEELLASESYDIT